MNYHSFERLRQTGNTKVLQVHLGHASPIKAITTWGDSSRRFSGDQT
ncbi:hypothetical protein [Desulfobacca acetoxidans]|nr:hypothetical protein [Desulfobacca acetoxidans]